MGSGTDRMGVYSFYDIHRLMKTLILSILILFVVSSCSSVHRLEKVRTTEANNLLESYYETVWNPENNRPGEQDSIKREIKSYLKTIK